MRYTVRAAEGTFPDYQRVFPTGHEVELETDVADLVNALAVGETGVNGAVKVDLIHGGPDSACFSATSEDGDESSALLNGSSRLTGSFVGDHEGEPIGLNYRYVADAARAMQCDRVLIRMKDPNSPATVYPASPVADSAIHCPRAVVMPIRL